jgi:hypothetical protein
LFETWISALATPKIMIGTPCYGGVVTEIYMQSCLALLREAAACGIHIEIYTLPNDPLLSRAGLQNSVFTSLMPARSVPRL